MVLSPAVTSWFQYPNTGLRLDHLVLPDVSLFVFGSFLLAVLLWRASPLAQPLAWILVGATVYATLICLQGAITRAMPTLCFVLMIPACMLTLHATIVGTGSGTFPFRSNRENAPMRIFFISMLQTAVFYLVFFVLIPMAIVRAQRELGWALFSVSPFVLTLAIVGFAVGGVLAISSAVQFAWKGKGTPIPTRAPQKLVVAGPYRMIRNPMAVGGIFQGIMVGLGLGSVPVMLYSLFGAVIWHVFVRPVEEADLERRFGAEYRAYASRVKYWWPSTRRG